MIKRGFQVLLVLLLVLLCAGHFAGIHFGKKWLNENGKELLGRKLQVDAIGINYITAAITVNGVVLYEDDDVTPFVSFKELYANVGLMPILKGDGYLIESASLDGFDATVEYLGNGFNFDSLVKHFAKSEEDSIPDSDKATEPIKWFVQSIEVSNSSFTYHDLKIGEDVTAENVNVSLPEGIAWNRLGVDGNLDLSLKSGGLVNAKFDFEDDYSAFKTDLSLVKVENEFLLPYVQDFLLVSDIEGTIGMDIHLFGSLTNPGDMNLSGLMRLDETQMVDANGKKLFGIGELVLNIDSLNPTNHVYAVRTINIDKPYGWFQLYKDGNNLSRLLKDSVVVQDTSNVQSDSTSAPINTAPTDHSSNFFMLIGDYVKQAMKDIHVTDFRLDTLSITGLHVDFEDHTMLMPFSYSTTNAELHSHGISSASDSVMVYSSAVLGQAGTLNMEARLDPTLHEDFKVNLQLSQIALNDVSPYFYQYLAHRVEKGSLGFHAAVDIQSGQLNSLLHLRIDSLEISKKEKHDEALKLPVKLAVNVLKGRSGIIDLEVPIEGNLRDPEYKLGKAIGKIFKNLITKSANKAPETTAPDSTVVLPADSVVLPVDTVAPIQP